MARPRPTATALAAAHTAEAAWWLDPSFETACAAYRALRFALTVPGLPLTGPDSQADLRVRCEAFCLRAACAATSAELSILFAPATA